MPLTPTSRLGLVTIDPNPSTGDFVDATVLNGNAAKIDDSVGAFPCTSVTRPTGSDRWHGRFIRETDTRRVLVWNATQAQWDLVADPAARLSLMCRKTTEPTNLTTTFLQDTQLRVTVPATGLGRYLLTGFIGWRSSALADLKVAFTHSAAGYTGRWRCDGASAADVTKPDLTLVFDSNILVLGGTAGLTSMTITGMANMASAGDFIFNWAQNTVDAAGNTFITLDSWFRLDPIS